MCVYVYIYIYIYICVCVCVCVCVRVCVCVCLFERAHMPVSIVHISLEHLFFVIVIVCVV